MAMTDATPYGLRPTLRALLLAPLVVVLLSSLQGCSAFTVAPGRTGRRFSFSSLSTELQGIKRRGKLGKTLEGMPSTTRRSKNTGPGKSKRKTAPSPPSSSSKKKETDSATIAPGLAAWMAQQSDETDSTDEQDTVEPTRSSPTDEADDRASFRRFDDATARTAKQTNKRRIKQSERKAAEEQRSARADAAVQNLLTALEENNNIDGILAAIRSILSIEPGNLRQIIASQRKLNYRLAWVGSDDAICHVGTGLHNVPLARLQEVFLSCLGRSRIELLEVIRILGPFPNVKNILQGNSKVSSTQDADATSWQITMDSMVDGTGKEILAGTEDNIRRVGLHVYFADENAIVAVVPGEDNAVRADPLENNGTNVLVFVRETELDEKLDALRVL